MPVDKSRIINKFKAYLGTNKLKFTSVRRSILMEVFANSGHFDAENLFQKLYKKNTGISHASVYRTLHLLVESKLISRTMRPDGGAVYENVFGSGHHDHIVCEICGRTIEFISPAIENNKKIICRTHGFTATEHMLEIRGYCKICLKKGGEKKK